MTPDDLLPRNWDNTPQEKSLTDDLMEVLCSTIVGWYPDLAQAPEVKRVIARYHHEVTHAGGTVT